MQDRLFTMTNLSQQDTGLPVVVWAAVKDEGCDAPCIFFQNSRAAEYLPDSLVPLAIEDGSLFSGHEGALRISDEDLEKIRQWVRLNRSALLEHWHGIISSAGLADRLKAIH